MAANRVTMTLDGNVIAAPMQFEEGERLMRTFGELSDDDRYHFVRSLTPEMRAILCQRDTECHHSELWDAHADEETYVHRTITEREDGLFFGQLDGAGPGTSSETRKMRINALNSIMTTMHRIGGCEGLIEELTAARPEAAKDLAAWNSFFETVSQRCWEKLQCLVDSPDKIRLQAKIAEFDLHHQGCCGQVDSN